MGKKKNKALETLVMVLLIIGGLNWGLQAVGYNVVNMLLGTISLLEKAAYILVGLAAIYKIYTMIAKK